MKKMTVVLLAIVLTLSLFSGPALAHHTVPSAALENYTGTSCIYHYQQYRACWTGRTKWANGKVYREYRHDTRVGYIFGSWQTKERDYHRVR